MVICCCIGIWPSGGLTRMSTTQVHGNLQWIVTQSTKEGNTKVDTSRQPADPFPSEEALFALFASVRLHEPKEVFGIQIDHPGRTDIVTAACRAETRFPGPADFHARRLAFDDWFDPLAII